MPLPESRRAMAARIDADRTRLENLGLSPARRFGVMARQHAYAAWKTTRNIHSVQSAIRSVLVGNPRLGLPGMTPLVRAAMVTAHVTGIRRTVLNVRKYTDARGLRLSTAYDGALDFLNRRMQLTPQEAQQLESQYGGPATRVIDTASASLESAVGKALVNATASGQGVAGGVTALREAFKSQGMTPLDDHQLEAIFRTQTNMAYSAGRWNSLNDPALKDMLWGFEYCAILDDRTTVLCNDLEGTKKPKDDPFWSTYTPPNHYNCRSTLLECLDGADGESTDQADPTPENLDQPARGFSFNPGAVYSDTIDITNGLPK